MCIQIVIISANYHLIIVDLNTVQCATPAVIKSLAFLGFFAVGPYFV